MAMADRGPRVNDLVELLKDPSNIVDREGRRPGDPLYDPRYLRVPPGMIDKMKPFDKQFWTIKKDHFDTVLFFKCGSFYEMYDRDADVAVQELEMKYRNNATCSMRTCGFPEKSVTLYAARLIGRGYKVGRVEELPKADTDKTVPRALCQVLTLATVTDLDMLMDDTPNYILALKETGSGIGACLGDLSRGSFRFARLGGPQGDSDAIAELATLLHVTKPKELLLERACLSKLAANCIDAELAGVRKTLLTPAAEFLEAAETRRLLAAEGYFPTAPPCPGIAAVWEDEAVMSAIGAMVWQLRNIKMDRQLLPLCNFAVFDPTEGGSCLALDGTTLANLEILEPATSGGETMLQRVCHCVTAFGRRRLRQWLCSPLRTAAQISRRQAAVAELVEHPDKRADLRKALKSLPDLERSLGRLGAAGREREVTWINAHVQNKRMIDLFCRTLAALRKACELVVEHEGKYDSPLLRELTSFVRAGGAFPDICEPVDKCGSGYEVIDEDGVAGSAMRPLPGADPEYDEHKVEYDRTLAGLNSHLKEVRAHYGCGDPKRSKAQWWHLGKEHFLIEVPRKETAACKPFPGFSEFKATQQVVRYHSARIRESVRAHLQVKSRFDAALRGFFKSHLRRFAEHGPLWQAAVDALATVDCLCSLAEVSSLPGMCRPEVVPRTGDAPPVFCIQGMVHPLARPAAGSRVDTVVPNDLVLGGGSPALALVTGPNMGGKSTLMRATCVAVILAQMGCYVPADSARMTPVDRVFTRIGASDKILSGQSTFMLEMRETSEMLRWATRDSLLVLDELGRGTATYDGYAIAHAVLHDIVTRLRCRCLFSTHYHQLCHDVGVWADQGTVGMHHMRYEIDPDTRAVSFLYRLGAGAATRSYGVDVARKAGLPAELLAVAQRKADRCRAADAMRQAEALPGLLLRAAQQVRAALREGDGKALAGLAPRVAATLALADDAGAASSPLDECAPPPKRPRVEPAASPGAAPACQPLPGR